MGKIILVSEVLDGIALLSNGVLVREGDANVLRRKVKTGGKVGLVIGGRSGHELLYSAFVGPGLAPAKDALVAAPPSPGGDLAIIGANFMCAGGTAGIVFGSWFSSAGRHFAARDLDARVLADAMATAARDVRNRGKSSPRDRTMVDAPTPAVEALDAGADQGVEAALVQAAAAMARWRRAEWRRGWAGQGIWASGARASSIRARSPSSSSSRDLRPSRRRAETGVRLGRRHRSGAAGGERGERK